VILSWNSATGTHYLVDAEIKVVATAVPQCSQWSCRVVRRNLSERI